ncbi:MAG: phosphonate ABC transporter ATP-binding protein [Planctomycetales bacterium]
MIDDPVVFQLEGVTVDYPSVRALDDVSLRIVKGEQVALVGPSGSGKTTLLRLLNGTVRPSGGVIHVLGSDTSLLSATQIRRLRSRIGFIHQDLSLVPNLRVLQNVLSGRMGQVSLLRSLRMMVLPSMAETLKVHRWLDQVGIEEKLYQRTDTLSGGQQQRVAIARALYQQPDALLADEPVSSVDPARAQETIRLLTTIASSEGLTLCTSLHNLGLAREYFSRLIGLREGRIVFDRQADEIDDDEFQTLYQLSGKNEQADREGK